MGEVFLTSPPPGYTPPYPQIEAPIGHWKDGLFDVFSYGLCHPQAWLSLCCTESKFLHSFFLFYLCYEKSREIDIGLIFLVMVFVKN